jgi:hypothetical protein
MKNRKINYKELVSKHKLVLVVWEDACVASGWNNFEEELRVDANFFKTVRCRTAGYVIRADGKCISVAPTISDDTYVQDVQSIPTKNVVELKLLEVKKNA